MPICTKCRRDKEEDCFGRHMGGRLRTECKDCRNANAKEYRKANSHRIGQQRKGKRQRNHERNLQDVDKLSNWYIRQLLDIDKDNKAPWVDTMIEVKRLQIKIRRMTNEQRNRIKG